METRTCQNCHNEFAIEPEDFKFYDKIKVPPPTRCPSCRVQRRLLLRNERRLYRRGCDLCKTSIISMYAKDKPFPVYCYSCWWGDGWNALDFAEELDLKRPFLEQYKILQNKVPRLALFNINAINSEYNNYALDNKDSYMNFRVVGSERAFYNYYCLAGVDCVNSAYVHKGELLSGCFDVRGCYNCRFLVDSENCVDSAYSYDLKNCSNCLFSWNLRSKNYHVRNKPVSPEEFKRIWAETVSGSRIKARHAKETFEKLYREKALHRYNKIIKSVNSQGANLVNCKNAFEVYYGTDSENVRYGDDVEKTRDSMDVKGPMESELAYECCSIDHGCARIYFSDFCQRGCVDAYYSSFCINSQNLFGCISLQNAKNCILNRQYSPAEYGELKNKLIGEMTRRGEFGENLGGMASPFAYNETVAMEHFPLSKEDALSKGYLWQDDPGGTYGKETVLQEDISDEIANVPDAVVKEILVCEKCNRNYPVAQGALLLYRRLSVPLPEKCPSCRYEELLRFRLPRKLWNRPCMCEIKNHDRHQGKRCPNEFETSYSPGRPEIVYCEECYLREVV
ncbi:zinc-ribbon domain containing protein [Candidatus Giovannonibacteria bacterium]|nr:zinc-ribbon domain containing protein [Candidatus Giovannonibacteria bacterium]